MSDSSSSGDLLPRDICVTSLVKAGVCHSGWMNKRERQRIQVGPELLSVCICLVLRYSGSLRCGSGSGGGGESWQADKYDWSSGDVISNQVIPHKLGKHPLVRAMLQQTKRSCLCAVLAQQVPAPSCRCSSSSSTQMQASRYNPQNNPIRLKAARLALEGREVFLVFLPKG